MRNKIFALMIPFLIHLHLQAGQVKTGHHRKIFSGSQPVNSPASSPIIFIAGQPVAFIAGQPVVVQ